MSDIDTAFIADGVSRIVDVLERIDDRLEHLERIDDRLRLIHAGLGWIGGNLDRLEQIHDRLKYLEQIHDRLEHLEQRHNRLEYLGWIYSRLGWIGDRLRYLELIDDRLETVCETLTEPEPVGAEYEVHAESDPADSVPPPGITGWQQSRRGRLYRGLIAGPKTGRLAVIIQTDDGGWLLRLMPTAEGADDRENLGVWPTAEIAAKAAAALDTVV